VDAVDFGFQQIVYAIKNSDKYEQLKRAVGGNVKCVRREWQTGDLVIEE
jgi:hypothetical protein